ncbi:hypothetical protein acsn021_11820 [Anaerocolumna cellulosilytica]|uniref:Stage 0 sporulation protein A homolog n=1 Tax=Anaerocolumna cellulosilytica TaxID=433286 RepID=A0A6S6QQL0_9FIRM|nr:response regulator [Anaerocolumna cellulosilytica]MBB5196082.1 two-component SAPR family response regulator [Anaerocolumna cellulosilytica]BCJ93613.1 hypothetical protein acsn021_11820 [Anaerocolumna cellulosilytica]
MLKIVIVDDEKPTLCLLNNLIKNIEGMEVIGKYTLPSEAYVGILTLKPDIVFMDIEMPGMNGIELAGKLLEKDEDLQIVYVTAHKHYALDIFKVNSINFIMKPINPEELTKTVIRLAKFKGIRQNNIEEKNYIKCFGTFEIRAKNGSNIKLTSKKSAELLAYFILNRNLQIEKWKIGEALWPENNENHVTSNFHTTLFRLRKTIEMFCSFINITSIKGSKDGYCCQLQNVDCDLIQFDNFYTKNLPLNAETIGEYEIISQLCKGELFEDFNYEWCYPYKQKYISRMVKVLEETADYFTKTKQYERALSYLYTSLKLDKFNESTNHKIMKIYYEQKDKNKLLKHFQSFQHVLENELNVPVEGENMRIYQKYILQ